MDMLRLLSNIKFLFTVWLMVNSAGIVQAQAVDEFWGDLKERLANKDYLQVHGSTQLGLRWNQISGISPRIQPFSGQLTAALLVDIIGIKGNFSAAFSDGNLTYNLPAYAFYGFSPSYKWIQLHLGDRSMELSPYTLSGQNFKGVGVELRPGNFHFAAFTGRLRAARQADAGAIQHLEPAFRRWGKGVQAGYDDGDARLEVTLFHAKDDIETLAFTDTLTIRPQENVVLDVQGKKKLGARFDVAFDLAHSALTRDLTAPEMAATSSGLNGRIWGLFHPNSSSAYGNAWQFEVGFTPTFARFNIKAQRMDAGFQSLGRLAFLNDTENVQLGANTTLFDKKLSLAASGGLQRNGLSATSTSKGARAIGSLNLGLNLSDRTSINASLSNINYTLRQRLSTVPFLVVDSIVLVQNNFSAQLSASFITGENKQSVIMLSGAFQRAGSIADLQSENALENDFYTGIAAYSWTPADTGWNLTLSCAANYTGIAGSTTTIISPSLQVQKTMLEDKLAVESGIAHSYVYNSLGARTGIWENRLGGQFKLSDKHHLRLYLTYVSNTTKDTTGASLPFQDFNAQLAYQFNF